MMLPIGRVSFKARAIAPLRPPPRTHLSLEKDSPASRSVQPPSIGSVVALSKAHFRSSGRTPLNAGVCVTLPLFVAMSVVLPTEGDRLAIEGEEPVIGNGHSMGVSGQVLQQVIGTAEGCIGPGTATGDRDRGRVLWRRRPTLSCTLVPRRRGTGSSGRDRRVRRRRRVFRRGIIV